MSLFGTKLYSNMFYSEFFLDNTFEIYVYFSGYLKTDETFFWKFYRRNNSIFPLEKVNNKHILVSSGETSNGIISIHLGDYELLYLNDDYYIEIFDSSNIKLTSFHISYYSDNYINNYTGPYFFKIILFK